jgi:hypothetical protein
MRNARRRENQIAEENFIFETKKNVLSNPPRSNHAKSPISRGQNGEGTRVLTGQSPRRHAAPLSSREKKNWTGSDSKKNKQTKR